MKQVIGTAQAVFDPVRMKMIKILAGGELCVCDIADTLAISQPRASQHLKILKAAGLVTERRCGKWMYYHLVSEALHAFLADLTCFVTSPDGGLPQMQALLDRAQELKTQARC